MWIVRNTLRGTLTFRGLGLSIPPEGEVDLDRALGRDRAERSNQVLVAFEEGYLETLQKRADGARGGNGAPHGAAAGVTSAELDAALDGRLGSFKDSLTEELQALRGQLSGDVQQVLEHLKVAKLKLTEEKQRVLTDRSLSDAEIRARLAFLEEQERELTTNFSSIGRKDDKAADDVTARADLLSSI